MKIGKVVHHFELPQYLCIGRLLSANGIPKLRGKAKHHLKFKGKGHEVGYQNSNFCSLR
jgi:hypothetical protein